MRRKGKTWTWNHRLKITQQISHFWAALSNVGCVVCCLAGIPWVHGDWTLLALQRMYSNIVFRNVERFPPMKDTWLWSCFLFSSFSINRLFLGWNLCQVKDYFFHLLLYCSYYQYCLLYAIISKIFSMDSVLVFFRRKDNARLMPVIS